MKNKSKVKRIISYVILTTQLLNIGSTAYQTNIVSAEALINSQDYKNVQVQDASTIPINANLGYRYEGSSKSG